MTNGRGLRAESREQGAGRGRKWRLGEGSGERGVES